MSHATSRIALSPWARAAFDAARLAELDAMATRLDVKVGTLKRAGKHGLWIARARSIDYQRAAEFIGQTPADAIYGALTKYEATAWTATTSA